MDENEKGEKQNVEDEVIAFQFAVADSGVASFSMAHTATLGILKQSNGNVIFSKIKLNHRFNAVPCRPPGEGRN